MQTVSVSLSLTASTIIQLTYVQINSSAKSECEYLKPFPCSCPCPTILCASSQPLYGNSCPINYSLHTFGRPAKFNRFMHTRKLLADQQTALSHSPTLLSLSATHALAFRSLVSFLFCLFHSVASLPFSTQVAASLFLLSSLQLARKKYKYKVKLKFFLCAPPLDYLDYIYLFFIALLSLSLSLCLAGSMSNKPILYYAPRSPPCRSVQLTAAALGIELDLR